MKRMDKRIVNGISRPVIGWEIPIGNGNWELMTIKAIYYL